MLQHLNTARNKKIPIKKREGWMWYEDPYKNDGGTWAHDGMVWSHGISIPAPNPSFGTGPPLHGRMQTA